MTKIKASEMVELQYYRREIGGVLQLLCVCNEPPTDKRQKHDLRVWHPSTETINIAHTETVEHLPDCTGWDWKPELTYTELSAKCELKVGDRVKVTHKTEPAGWRGWQPAMYDMLGHVFTIADTIYNHGSNGKYFWLKNGNDGYYFPCTSLEKVEAKYRPFSCAEFKEHRGKWFKYAGDTTTGDLFQPGRYDNTGVRISLTQEITWERLLKDYAFEDDTPCGVLHYEHTTPQ